MNNSNATQPPGCGGDPSGNSYNNSVFTREVIPVLYCLIFAAGLILNILAAWIFFKVPSTSGLVVYLKNMVVADLLMLFSFPWRVVSDLGHGGWYLKMVVCRYTAVLYYLGMYIGIVFMGLISLERYVKIVHASPCSPQPCSLRASNLLQRVTVSRCLALLSWAIMLLCMLPNSLLTNKPAAEGCSCMNLKSDLGLLWHKISAHTGVAIFWVTLVLMSFCYFSIAWQVYSSYQRVRRGSSNASRRSNQSIYSLLAVFFVCFVPYHALRVPYTLSQTFSNHFSDKTKFHFFQAKEATQFMASFNVCLDPLIYFLMCRTFRELLMRKFSRTKAVNVMPSVTNRLSTSNL
ncbi:P2Y purinoceptor 14 [Clarias gariepinus]|uniref:P2Y purinoceptor 14 n=1 Tax=Clarias gariepinus TaxID=13013 RepID=UPI00234D6FCE|nr:P2Y purinoceptor 14 [Clarias gariepinus]